MFEPIDFSGSREVIQQSRVISDDDFAFIDSQMNELMANWEKNQKFRTETEMRVSVLNDVKFPTPAAKYWQCVREQASFYATLVEESFVFRRNRIKLQQLERKLDKCKDDLKRELIKLDIEELNFVQTSLRARAADRVRELRLWSQIMEELTDEDSGFDTQNVNAHQLYSYLQRWSAQLHGLDRSKSSVSEVNNLIGQYRTGIRRAVELGIAIPDNIAHDAKQLGLAITPRDLLGRTG